MNINTNGPRGTSRLAVFPLARSSDDNGLVASRRLIGIAPWRSLGFPLPSSPKAVEYLFERIMQVQTILNTKSIASGQSEAEASPRLQLAAKARQKDNKVEFAHVVHRALIALRLSKSPNAANLLEQIHAQHPAE